jgi:hypothetical protein
MKTTSPSSEFLVGQAVLTAMLKLYPHTMVLDGPRAVGHRLWGLVHDEFGEGRAFCDHVRIEYRLLCSQQAQV